MAAGEKTQGELDLRYWRRCGYGGDFVYVLQALPSTPVKVGYTNDVDARIRTLQTGNPYQLRPLTVIPAGQRLEAWLHQHMHTLRLSGEWFDGAELQHHLVQIGEMAAAIRAAHNKAQPDAPPFEDFAAWIPYRIRRKALERARSEVEVRYVDPAPVDIAEAQANLRAHYLRPARPYIKQGGP